jgi:hypothetical protein
METGSLRPGRPGDRSEGEERACAMIAPGGRAGHHGRATGRGPAPTSRMRRAAEVGSVAAVPPASRSSRQLRSEPTIASSSIGRAIDGHRPVTSAATRSHAAARGREVRDSPAAAARGSRPFPPPIVQDEPRPEGSRGRRRGRRTALSSSARVSRRSPTAPGQPDAAWPDPPRPPGAPIPRDDGSAPLRAPLATMQSHG